MIIVELIVRIIEKLVISTKLNIYIRQTPLNSTQKITDKISD